MRGKIGGSKSSNGRQRRGVISGLLVPAALAVLCLAAPSSGVAHSGGLDKIGCHHDRKNGGYHCHRGPLAGQAFSSKEEALKALEKKQADEEAAKKAAENGKKN